MCDIDATATLDTYFGDIVYWFFRFLITNKTNYFANDAQNNVKTPEVIIYVLHKLNIVTFMETHLRTHTTSKYLHYIIYLF